ncbi:Dbl homology domain-containing protein [Thamnocephalis sphaerospora]|uniref:Dbl homology domain-containing protein n=1 Tax=Thamnocephalis sphaerospora TaxID=78915 RepID=A0A4P9XJW6_9FUNG|nr:Dbl homology domain-containing protein [Thamnocephalis sphaerospora]|eukprot:RKP06083.1 Dbl homology domain-containing protein [Thamnocephalis sphaerospora]
MYSAQLRYAHGTGAAHAYNVYASPATELENPFETAEVLDDEQDSSNSDGEGTENPFECSELEYSEEDDDDDDDDNLPLSATLCPPMGVISGQLDKFTLRQRSRSEATLTCDQPGSRLPARPLSNGSLSPGLSMEQRRASVGTAVGDSFVLAVLERAKEQNSIDRAHTWSGTVTAHTLATMSDDERKRQETIFELITTEHSFLRSMQGVVEAFREPLRKLMPESDVNGIFLNIDEILVCSASLLNDMLDRQQDDKRVIKQIGDILFVHMPEMQCYRTYCCQQASASRRLQHQRSRDPRVVAQLQEARRDSRVRKLDLSSFLIEPMQRITRYKLLLKQASRIHDRTPADHSDKAMLKDVLASVSELLDETNESTRVLENLEKLREISSWVDLTCLDKNFDLTGQTIYFEQREFIMEGKLVKANSGRKLLVYLFNDMLLLTQPPKHRSTSGYKNAIYREPLLLSDITVRSEPTNKRASGETCFQIVHGNHVITLKAPNIGSKTKWVREIELAKVQFRDAKQRLDGAPPPPSTVIGSMRVLVCEAGALVNPDQHAFRTTVNSFCVITACGQRQSTSMIANSNNPRWQESFIFPVDDLSEVIRVDVYHRTSLYGQPDFLGSCELPMSTLDPYGGKSTKTTMRLSNTRRTGSVTLHVTFDPK